MGDIWQAIRKAARAEPNGDENVLARQLVMSHTKEELIPVVADRIANAQRNLVSSAEREATAGAETAEFRTKFREQYIDRLMSGMKPKVKESMAVFRPLFDTTIRIGDGTPPIKRVDATAEQMRIRLAMLDAQILGLQRTRALDAEHLRILEVTGAKTLGDVQDKAA